MKYNFNLDSLRAVAALAVIAAHYEHLLPWGWVGVQFFFVLSGFLISGLILRAKDQNEGLTTFLPRFFVRRGLRLFPLYFGYIGVIFMIYGITKVPDAVKTEWVGLLTYTLNFRWLLPDYQFHAFIGHLWSLCVEWQFYLLWPFVLWHLSLSKLAKLCLLVLPIGMVIRLAIHWVAFRSEGLAAFNNMEQAAVAVYALPFSHIDAFALGAAINLPQIRDFLGSPRVVIALLGVTLASGLTTLGFVSGHYPISSMGWLCTLPEAGQWVWGYTVLNLASAAVIAAVLNNTCAWLKFTEWPFLQYLGKISYGIYVYHSPLVYVVYSVLSKTKPFMGRGVAGLMIVTLLTVVAAHLSYRYWESKFLKIKARVAS